MIELRLPICVHEMIETERTGVQGISRWTKYDGKAVQ